MNDNFNSPQFRKTIDSLWRLEKVILDSLDFKEVVQRVVDSVLSELGYLKLDYRIIVLALIDDKEKVVKRISISQTEDAKKAVEISPIPFKDIDIPLSDVNNFCVKAILENKPFFTHDWIDILGPTYSADDARQVQHAVGIKTSMVYPITYRGLSRGVMIFSLSKDEKEVSEEEKDLIRSYTDVVGIAVENAKLYSDLEQTSKRLDEANKKLEVLDKLKDEFVSVASHELRTPMTAIKSYTWMVLNGRSGDVNPKTREYLDRVYQSTDRLIHLVNEMLDVSRIEGGRVTIKIESVDMFKLACDVQAEFSARSAETGLTLNVLSLPDLPAVTADREKIHQVLENLVGNSFKFTPRGGHVTIGFKINGSYLETSVTDDGPGIDPDDLPKLFKKFGRLENSLVSLTNNSTGLGLYISKQYVELLHGQIWVNSQTGSGAIFTFSLPVAIPTPLG